MFRGSGPGVPEGFGGFGGRFRALAVQRLWGLGFRGFRVRGV